MTNIDQTRRLCCDFWYWLNISNEKGNINISHVKCNDFVDNVVSYKCVPLLERCSLIQSFSFLLMSIEFEPRLSKVRVSVSERRLFTFFFLSQMSVCKVYDVHIVFVCMLLDSLVSYQMLYVCIICWCFLMLLSACRVVCTVVTINCALMTHVVFLSLPFDTFAYYEQAK